MIGKICAFCNNPKAIENYCDAVNDTKQMWMCHHRDETDLGLSQKELEERGEYHNLPPSKLIYLPKLIHQLTHYLGYIPERKFWYLWLDYPFNTLPLHQLGEIVDILHEQKRCVIRTAKETKQMCGNSDRWRNFNK